MMNWIRENALSLAATAVICISTVAVTRFQIAGLVAAQPEIRHHMNDSTRHIDPQRDGESAEELKKRIERLERHIERLERRQAWMVNSVRSGSTSSIPIFQTPPPN
jgi:hypothetical protein